MPVVTLTILLSALGGAPSAQIGGTATTFTIGGGETVAAEHGSLTVPANRREATAGSLVLRYVRFRSTAANPGAPIVFLAGGPGDAATRAFAGMPRAFLDMLRDTADVIAFDQRGTGTSEPAALCPPAPMAPVTAAFVPDEGIRGLKERLRQCLLQLTARGVDVRGLTTGESADDVDALRVALGTPQVTLLAGSYGTHLAMAVARRHPTRIARMALLGVEGPDHTVKMPAAVDAVIREIEATHPGVTAAILQLRARLRDQPWTRTLPNGQAVTVGEWDLQRRVADALDTTREIETLVAALPAMMSGDYSDLVRWAIPFRSARPMNVMNIAMDCASFASPDRLTAVRRQEPVSLLGSAMNFPLPDLCTVEGLPRLADDFRAPLVSDVPTLLVSGTWDGRTPPANAEDVARTLSRVDVVVIPRASHGLFQHAEATAALGRFLKKTAE